MPVHSVSLTVYPTVMTFFFQSCGERFSKTKFRDCSIKTEVLEVCCLLKTVCVDGVEHSSVERL